MMGAMSRTSVSSSLLLSAAESNILSSRNDAASSSCDFRLKKIRCQRASLRKDWHFSVKCGESLREKTSRTALPQHGIVGFWNSVSTARLACLATTVLAIAIDGSALAGTELSASTTSDENSNFMFVVVCIGEAIALTGAAVGGVLARQRKVELEKINAQLRQINVNLRRQSRVESYAPNLTYAPVGSGRMLESQVRDDPEREEMMQILKTGKRFLREQNPAKAYGEFQKALALARRLKDTAEEKKAARGIGASCQRQRKWKEAITYHMLVLQISKSTGEGSGDTEAYGAIADCYTELGDLETAGKYYDKYIERLETDDAI